MPPIHSGRRRWRSRMGNRCSRAIWGRVQYRRRSIRWRSPPRGCPGVPPMPGTRRRSGWCLNCRTGEYCPIRFSVRPRANRCRRPGRYRARRGFANRPRWPRRTRTASGRRRGRWSRNRPPPGSPRRRLYRRTGG